MAEFSFSIVISVVFSIISSLVVGLSLGRALGTLTFVIALALSIYAVTCFIANKKNGKPENQIYVWLALKKIALGIGKKSLVTSSESWEID